MSDYFSLQGRIYIANRLPSGMPGPFRYVGNTPEAAFSMSADIFEHQESETGQRLTDLRLPRAKSASLRLVLEAMTRKNLALAVQGTPGTIAPGSVSNEVLPSGLVVGDIITTVKPNISAVTMTDSTDPTPQALTLNTHYRIVDPKAGLVEILQLTTPTLVQPLRISYTAAETPTIPMFVEGVIERWFRFVGVDTANENKAKMIDLYRVSFDPVQEFQLKTNEANQAPLNGGVLYDELKSGDSALGQFGRIVLLEE